MSTVLLDQLLRLYQEGCHPRTGRPPDFLTAPFGCLDQLELELASVCVEQVGPDDRDTPFMVRMVRGGVTINAVPVHPGACWGIGTRSDLPDVPVHATAKA